MTGKPGNHRKLHNAACRPSRGWSPVPAEFQSVSAVFKELKRREHAAETEKLRFSTEASRGGSRASAEPQRPLVDRRRRGDAFSHSHFFCKLLSMFVVCELITFA